MVHCVVTMSQKMLQGHCTKMLSSHMPVTSVMEGCIKQKRLQVTSK